MSAVRCRQVAKSNKRKAEEARNDEDDENEPKKQKVKEKSSIYIDD